MFELLVLSYWIPCVLICKSVKILQAKNDSKF